MDDPLLVRDGERGGDLHRVVDGLANGNRLRVDLADQLAEGLPLQQLHDDVRRAFGGADVEDGDQAGMIERAGGAGFLLEAGDALVAVVNESASTFTATSRPMRWSRARHTSPIPPSPIRAMIS